MAYLQVLHNGDLRKDSPKPSPHWMVHVWRDGRVWGEVLTPAGGRWLPEGFRIPRHERLFEIPAELSRHRLTERPHHEEIIISLPVGDEEFLCSFLMSQLPRGCVLRSALEDLLILIDEFTERTEPGAPPKSRPAGPLPSSAEVRTFDSQRTSPSGGCG